MVAIASLYAFLQANLTGCVIGLLPKCAVKAARAFWSVKKHYIF